MTSRIAALQARLKAQKGGGMLMMGMRPGAARPIRRSKSPRRNSLDNSALLNRPVINTDRHKPHKMSRKSHKIKAEALVYMDEHMEDDDIKYDESFASDIIVGAAQEISSTASVPSSNISSKPLKPWMKNRTPMMGMRLPMKVADSYKPKKLAPVKFNARTRTASRSFSRGVSNIPLLTPNVDSTIDTTSTANITNDTVPPAVMEMITDEPNIKHIRLFYPISNYMNGKKGNSHKGYIIAELLENTKYGKALKDIGIENGWKLIQIGSSTNITTISYFIVKNQLANEYRRGGSKGYELRFERCSVEKSVGMMGMMMGRKPVGFGKNQNQKIAKPLKRKVVLKMKPKKSSCELVSSGPGWKTIRLFGLCNKYFEGIAGENGKGMVVEKIIDHEFEELGVGIGWKLRKLGKKNVMKKGFRMLNITLVAQGSAAQQKGFELTFEGEEIVVKSEVADDVKQAEIAVNVQSKPNIVEPVSTVVDIKPTSVVENKPFIIKNNAAAVNASTILKSVEIAVDSNAVNSKPSTVKYKHQMIQIADTPSTDSKPTFKPTIKSSKEYSPMKEKKNSPIVKANEYSAVKAKDYSSVKAKEYSPLKAKDYSPVKAKDYSPVKAKDYSPVKAKEYSPVKAKDYSPVKAKEYSSVKAKDYSPVKAKDYSPVKAKDYSPVKAKKYSPIVKTKEYSPMTKTKPLPSPKSKIPAVENDSQDSKPTKVEEKEPILEKKNEEKVDITVISNATIDEISVDNESKNESVSTLSMVDSIPATSTPDPSTKPKNKPYSYPKKQIKKNVKSKKLKVKEQKTRKTSNTVSVTTNISTTFDNKKPLSGKNKRKKIKRTVTSPMKSKKIVRQKSQPTKNLPLNINTSAKKIKSKKVKGKAGKKTPKNKTPKTPKNKTPKTPKNKTPKTPKNKTPKTPKKLRSKTPKVKIQKKAKKNTKANKTPTPIKKKTKKVKKKLKSYGNSSSSSENDGSASSSSNVTSDEMNDPFSIPATNSITPVSSVPLSTKPFSNPPLSSPPFKESPAMKQTIMRKRNSSYSPPATCKLISQNTTEKIIKLYQIYDSFFEIEPISAENNKGMKISKICNNEFGLAIKKLGVSIGSKIIKCERKILPETKNFSMLKNQLRAQSKTCGENGYNVTFVCGMVAVLEEGDENKNNYAAIKPTLWFDDEDDDQKNENKNSGRKKKRNSVGSDHSSTPNSPSVSLEKPLSMGKASVELIVNDGGSVCVRVHHSLDKYFVSCPVLKSVGYKIKEFKKPFGDDIEQFGVCKDWQLSKIGNKDVEEMNFLIIKTNLEVEWRKSKLTGFEVTFGT